MMRAPSLLPMICMAVVVCHCQGFMSARPGFAAGVKAHSALRMAADVHGVVDAAFKKIEADQALRPSDHAEAMELDAFTVGDVSGTIEGYLGTKVDWCSKVSTKGPGGDASYALSCWTFPMYDVPHLTVALSKSGDTLTLKADLIAKDDTMYSQDYLESYYGGETLAWYESIVGNAHTTSLPVPATLRGRALASPGLVHVSGPESEVAELFAASVDKITDMWLAWLADAAEIARVRRGTMLSRDNILRRMSWAVTCKDPMFGDQSQQIATAIAGPGDMAYVGQYS
ncbi:hypothetical protein JKP88DRAFT_12018 [Tribonema minus]|uniref:Uncharacterized protein n=1 Tax=Tribonema minus TaxID=303371 RepID=A0A836CMT3_9STRA|nr:hypothetical protein JKP88DRAFT_12018 [Tribonema minus]